jgi:hypothetical protein
MSEFGPGLREPLYETDSQEYADNLAMLITGELVRLEELPRGDDPDGGDPARLIGPINPPDREGIALAA